MNLNNIHKSKNNVLAGVAAGIAEHQGINPFNVRALFAIAAILTGGIALLVYTVFAFMMAPPSE